VLKDVTGNDASLTSDHISQSQVELPREILAPFPLL
jgi:hypothetical protein